MTTSARSRVLGNSPSLTVGTITGVGVVLTVVIVLESLGLTSLHTIGASVSIGFVLAVSGCTIGTAVYGVKRDPDLEQLDAKFISSFMISVTVGVFLWQLLHGIVVFVNLLQHGSTGAPFAIFIFGLYVAVAFVSGFIALILAGVAGILSTVGVAYVYTLFNS